MSITNIDADFFTDLGGSSLQSVLLLDELAQEFNQELESHNLFQYRTIRQLAKLFKNEEETASLPCIHWISTKPKAHLPNFFLIETGHYSSYKNLLKAPISSEFFNLAYLRIDPFKVLTSHHTEEILEEIINLLALFPQPILLATSFSGFVAAKINQELGGSLILIDSPWYRKEKGGGIPLKNRLSPIYHRFRSLPFRSAFLQVSSLVLGYSLKKLSRKKEFVSPFEKTIQLFISQTDSPVEISNLLYFYSTGSSITSQKDVENWKGITIGNFSKINISGDHLDALMEDNSNLVLREINEFLTSVHSK